MTFWIWAIAFLLIIFLFSLYINVQVTIKIQEDKSFQGVSVQVNSRFYKTSRQYDYTDPNFSLIESILISAIENMQRDAKSETSSSDNYNGFLQNLKGFPIRNLYKLSLQNSDLFGAVLKYTVVDSLEWISTVGSKDALRTALTTGVCWALKGTLIGLLSSKCKLKRSLLDVKPDFMAPVFLSSLTCILKMRIVHIIFIETYAIVIKVRWCLNGITTRTAESSH